jgi:hypothetical protein
VGSLTLRQLAKQALEQWSGETRLDGYARGVWQVSAPLHRELSNWDWQALLVHMKRLQRARGGKDEQTLGVDQGPVE